MPLPAGAGGAVTNAALAADPAGQRRSATRDPSARASFGIPLPARVPEPGEARKSARNHTGRRAREGSRHRGVDVFVPRRANPALAGLLSEKSSGRRRNGPDPPPREEGGAGMVVCGYGSGRGGHSDSVRAGSVRQVPSGQVQSGRFRPGLSRGKRRLSFAAWVAVSKDSRGGPGGAGTELWKRPRPRSRHPANYRQRGSTKELAPRTRTRDRGWRR